MAIGEAADAAARDAVDEAGWCVGGVPVVAVTHTGSPEHGDGERGGATDVVGSVDALAVDGDAPCAPLAPPIHV